MRKFQDYILTKYKELCEFVHDSVRHFDESHDFNHALDVTNNALIILDEEENIQYLDFMTPDHYERCVVYSAMLHDVCDHKYPNSIPKEELVKFVQENFSLDESQKIIDIIDSVSYSKEIKGLRKELSIPYDQILHIVSDADKLEAIGTKGIERCEIFGRLKGQAIPEHVIRHCHEKLLKLLPGGFFRTKSGQELAKPRHEIIVNYVKKHE